MFCDVTRRQAELRVRLRIDLEGAAELVELVDEGRTHVGRQRREDLVGRDMQRLGLDPVHLDVELRHHRAERRTDPLQRALRRRIGDDRAGDRLQLAEVGIAVAELDLHRKAGGVADALDRRRRDHQDPRLLDDGQLLVQSDEQRPQILALAARAPLFQDQIGDAGIGEAGRIVERGDAGNGDDLIDARGLAGYLADLGQHTLGTLKRRAIGQLHGDQQIALILDRNEAGRHPRQAVAGDADQDQRADDRNIAVRDQPADQPAIARPRRGYRPH